MESATNKAVMDDVGTIRDERMRRIVATRIPLEVGKTRYNQKQ
jgi:hypothetical protein